jgi:DNA-binding NtrC family response regulator
MKKIRAIIIDDDESIRLTLESVLNSWGYEVHSYYEPVFCSIECRCNLNFPCTDIIITDINMPNVSGFDFIEHQIQIGCKVNNIAIMSGYWTDQYLEKALKIGCQIFEKPFDLKDLHQWLDGIEKRINTHRELTDLPNQN